MTHTSTLSAIYGTESDLVKEADGSASVALRLAAAMLAMGTIDRMQNSYNYAQARSMITNRAVRGADRDMMEAQVAGPLRHTRAPILVAPDMSQGAIPNVGVYPGMPVGMDEGMVRLASVVSAAGADLAATRVLEEMEKDAIMGMPQFGATSRMMAAGGMTAPSIASRAAGAVKNVGSAAAGAVGHAVGAVGNAAQQARQAISPTARMQAAYKGVPAPAAAPAAPAPGPAKPGFIERAKNVMNPTARFEAEAARQGVQTRPAAPAAPAPTAQVPGQIASTNGQPPRSAPPGEAGHQAPAAAAPHQEPAGAAPTAASKKEEGGFDLGGFIDKSVGTPGRALRTGAGLLGVGALAYGGSKLLGKGLQVMSEENQPADWGSTSAGAPVLPMGVNQYGYAQRGTPFMT